MFSGRWTVCGTLCLALLVSGCGGDDDSEGDDPPASPSASATGSSEPTAPTSPTVEPATGPVLTLKGVSLNLPEGWHVDNDDSNILVVGADKDSDVLINLSSFPSLDPNASIAALARSTQKTGGYPANSVQPPATMAGRPAFHVAGEVAGDYTEEFGLLNGGDIVSVEFVFWNAPKAGRQELIDSVLATVQLP